MKRVGEILKDLREAKGLLIREVAAGVNVDTAILSKIERAERLPTKKQVLLLAKFFSFDKNELMVSYLSDKLVYDLNGEEVAIRVIHVAEKKIRYLSKKEAKGK
jgi:transcriptional regulator with XRE-family HTH domain